MYSLQQLKNIFDNQQLLIVLLCRLYFSKVSKTAINDFLQNNHIDYSKFITLCRTHGISSFIYSVINIHDITIDRDATEVLRHRFLNNQVACLEQLALTSRLQQSLLQKDIRIIPYKGFVFSVKYYRSLGLRESSDMDFIVNENDAEAIEQYLVEAGFRPKTTVPSFYREYYRKNFKDISYAVPSRSKADGYSAEMHWRLLNAHYGAYATYRYFNNGLFRHQVQGMKLLSLSTHYDLAAIVSNHFIKDIGSKFKYVIDIACLLSEKGTEVDTASFMKLLREYGFEKQVSFGFFLAEALLGQQFPGEKSAYGFSSNFLKYTLEYRPPLIKISNATFLKRSLALQDSFPAKLHFLVRCFYYYMLPAASDIPQNSSYPIPLLALRRLYHSAGKAVQRSFSRRKKIH